MMARLSLTGASLLAVDPAIASLVVSVVALAVSVGVALWNVVKFVLDGGRVRVHLKRGALSDVRLLERPFGGRADNPLTETDPKHVEVAILRVENLGRTAVTVSNASLDLGFSRHKSHRLFGRHTVQPRFYAFSGCTTEHVVRLQPFDSITFLLDAETVLSMLRREDRKRATWIRGSVRVAGKRLARRSAWHKAWRIEPGQQALTPGEVPTAEQVVYRAVRFAAAGFEEGGPLAYVPAWEIQRHLDAGKPLNADFVQETIEAAWRHREGGEVRGLTVGFAVRDKLREYGYLPRDDG